MESLKEFKELQHRFLNFFNENMFMVCLIGGLVVCFAVGIPTGIWGYKAKKKSASENAWYRMSETNKVLLDSVQKGVREDALLDTIDDYVDIRNSLSTTDATPWLLLNLGNAQYESGNFDDAIETYGELINKYSNHSAVSLARLSLGNTYEEKGMFQEALEQFEEIKALEVARSSEALLTTPFIKAQRALNMGRCYEKLGSMELARNAYNEATELSPGTDVARMAQYRISLFEEK